MDTALGLKSEERMIRKGYIRYLIPTTVALCFSQIAPLVDSLCISEVMGEEALSAMSTVSPIYYIFNIIGSFAGIGGGIAVAKAMGSGDKYAGGRAFTKALLWTTVSTLILSVLILIFIDPLLKLLCATEGNFMYAKEYLRVLVAGMVFYVINYSMTYILTDDNDANLSMAVGIVSGIVNMIVDVVGMFVLHQGIWVTAFGTVFGMFVGCLVCLVHMRKKDRICRFTPKKAGVPDIKLTEIMSPGMPEASEYLLFALQMLQSNYILSSSIGTSGLGNAAVPRNRARRLVDGDGDIARDRLGSRIPTFNAAEIIGCKLVGRGRVDCRVLIRAHRGNGGAVRPCPAARQRDASQRQR